jgi:hypothetical protein
MSTGNIAAIIPIGAPIPTGVNVVFNTHGGGQREYYYEGTEAALAIMAGDDPAHYDGVQGGAPSGIGEAIDIAIDITELGLL